MIARFVMACVVFTASGLCAKQAGKDDKELLQGEWVVVSTKSAGEEVDGLKDRKLVVKGDDWFPPVGGAMKFIIKLDAKNRKQLDLIRGGGDGKEKTWPGIYKIEGDTLTFCRSTGAGGERPTEFNSGPRTTLIVFKRAQQK